MRRWVIALGVLGALALSVVVQSHTSSFARGAAQNGWISLFDGRTLKGWQVHTGGNWKVEKGAIVCPGTSAGWLGTLSPSNWIVNTLMLEGCTVPFRFKRKQSCRNLKGRRVNLTYYPASEIVGGMEFEVMNVVRIRVA